MSLTAVAEDSGWYSGFHGGLSSLSDPEGNFARQEVNQVASGNADSGAFAGISGGYRFGNGWRMEMAWEYRNNELVGKIGPLDFPKADFASGMVYLNGIYILSNSSGWRPYVGAGLSWAQEIDIDFERDGAEQSYSTSGDTGFQIFTGIEYDLSPHWIFSGELRYGNVSGLDLDPESGALGMIEDMDYEHISLQLGISYRF